MACDTSFRSSQSAQLMSIDLRSKSSVGMLYVFQPDITQWWHSSFVEQQEWSTPLEFTLVFNNIHSGHFQKCRLFAKIACGLSRTFY